MRGLSPVAPSGGHSSSWCADLSLSRPLLLRSTGSRRAGSVVVAHGRSCSAACGIFPDQGSNPRPPHWQADSQPLRHEGSPPDLLCSQGGFRYGGSWLWIRLLSSRQCSKSLKQVHTTWYPITRTLEPARNLAEPSCLLSYYPGPLASVSFYFISQSGTRSTADEEVGTAVCTLGVSVAERALKPHPPFFHLTKRNSAKELSHKSMRGAGPFRSSSSSAFSCSRWCSGFFTYIQWPQHRLS